jgi:putative addiction module killer protein
MIEIRQTLEFRSWRETMHDDKAKAALARRIVRLQAGLLGDVKYPGDGLSELRLDIGPGYRVYLHRRGDVMVILLCGGDKRGQAADIRRAKAMISDLEF